MSQSKTPVHLQYIKYYIRCSAGLGVAPSTFFCISMTRVDPPSRCALFILLTIQKFLHPTVTLIVFMPQWTGNLQELVAGSKPTDFLWTLVKLHILSTTRKTHQTLKFENQSLWKFLPPNSLALHSMKILLLRAMQIRSLVINLSLLLSWGDSIASCLQM